MWHEGSNHEVSDMLDVYMQARQGEGESTPDDILEMVKAQAAPPHRSLLNMSSTACQALAFHCDCSTDGMAALAKRQTLRQ